MVDDNALKEKIYELRGQKVMLDVDLAEIYGYETKNFNRQVKNNIAKFDDDFMFQLTNEDLEILSRCKNFTLNMKTGRGSNIKYKPYAFTEQGIYMLMTVLKGELAVAQSKALIRTFQKMKHILVENQDFLLAKEVLQLAIQTSKNTQDITEIKEKMATKEDLIPIKEDLKKVMDNFINPNTYKHFLIMDGQKIEAGLAYSQIYQSAQKSIYVVDNYISLKTLALLRAAKEDVEIIIFSDNLKNKEQLTQPFLDDFKADYPTRSLTLKTTHNKYHDRYIAIDLGTKNAAIYHCGASSKDAGNKITSIHRVEDTELYLPMFDTLLKNPNLILKE